MAYPATGTPSDVSTGAGWLYVAPLGTTEPTLASAALPSAWREVGYTDAGSVVSTDITTEDIEVAEETDPIATIQSKRNLTIAFAMAEATRRNLALALGAGIDETAGVFDFPDFEDLVSVMLIHQAPTGARWIFRKVAPSGSSALNNQKSPQKRLLAVTMNASVPDAGLPVASVIPAGAGTAGDTV